MATILAREVLEGRKQIKINTVNEISEAIPKNFDTQRLYVSLKVAVLPLFNNFGSTTVLLWEGDRMISAPLSDDRSIKETALGLLVGQVISVDNFGYTPFIQNDVPLGSNKVKEILNKRGINESPIKIDVCVCPMDAYCYKRVQYDGRNLGLFPCVQEDHALTIVVVAMCHYHSRHSMPKFSGLSVVDGLALRSKGQVLGSTSSPNVLTPEQKVIVELLGEFEHSSLL